MYAKECSQVWHIMYYYYFHYMTLNVIKYAIHSLDLIVLYIFLEININFIIIHYLSY